MAFDAAPRDSVSPKEADNRTASSSLVHEGLPVVIKKYSCMYTSDVYKNKKVWHDGEVRLHHVNSKAYLYSDRSDRLAETFVKAASRRSRLTSQPNAGPSCQLPDTFALTEDDEIEFNQVEDDHQLRASCYLAQIVNLIEVGYKVLPVATPINPQARQESSKRKMEFLDEHIKQSVKSKRPHPSNASTSKPVPQITPARSRPHNDTHTSPLKAIDSLRKRMITPLQAMPLQNALLAQPFHSPLRNRSAAPSELDSCPSHDTPSRNPFRPRPQIDQPISPHGSRVSNLKTLDMEWDSFCDASDEPDQT
ncbi:uncharacterized protein MELLADRAFT_71680 [Melampsora larici-populina 98AG31]|uniref:5'-3' DNA helicase ZGRF1-like N-terminal domain-containing protein n=1 Tax=Melampsora larici-populina (strain 98AG31 / pathotype 3-4-7) TaxID=747676 RepID=F4RJE5_MELLP|nr:uncharacterized protein MELLADRAFT_71680 [Melampsora larici-populina 98AG31]EGG07511.1 hypothetical protein MELLADRAFT_71680 [Melampsora larici-populina 98AG31]